MTTIYEMTSLPVAGFKPCAWQDGWTRVNTSADGKPDWKSAAERHALIVSGKTSGLTFASPEGKTVAERMAGQLAILDREVLGPNLYDACRVFKRKAPKAKLTTYGFLGSYDIHSLATSGTALIRQQIAALRQYANLVDLIDVAIYLCRDNSQAVDDDRDCARWLLYFDRLIDLCRQTFAGKPLASVIWPRMLFSNKLPDGSVIPDAPVPDAWIDEYVRVACRCEAVIVFDLRVTDEKFIAALRNWSRGAPVRQLPTP